MFQHLCLFLSMHSCISAWGFSSECHIQAPSLFLPPALISINHFSHFWLCKSCQLPIISDYSHLGGGRGDVVSKVAFWFTGFLQSVCCSLCAEQYISVEVVYVYKMYNLEWTVTLSDNRFRVSGIIKYLYSYLFTLYLVIQCTVTGV